MSTSLKDAFKEAAGFTVAVGGVSIIIGGVIGAFFLAATLPVAAPLAIGAGIAAGTASVFTGALALCGGAKMAR